MNDPATEAAPLSPQEQHLLAFLATRSAGDMLTLAAAQLQDEQLVESARQGGELIDAPGLGVRHKLKLTIPLLPLLLAYEGVFELDNRLNLEAAWQAIKGLIVGGRDK